MPSMTLIRRDGTEMPFSAAGGQSVVQIIRDVGVDELLASCGGSCSCGTCHAHVDPPWLDGLSPKSSFERGFLELSDHYNELFRLSCQIAFDDDLNGLDVTIAPED